jgi:creatinine amidohydrolase
VDLLPTATSADERERGAQIAVLPVGSFEQHGGRLPLITDTVVACSIARAIADGYELTLLPPITISCSHEHSTFAGTVSIRATTLYLLVKDIAESLAASGKPKLIVVNGHGGNYVLSNVVQELNAGQVCAALFPASKHWENARRAAGMTSTQHEDMHAGELETSVLLATFPELVHPEIEAKDHLADDRSLLPTLGMAGLTGTGVVGRPSLASAERGKSLVKGLVSEAASVVRVLS